MPLTWRLTYNNTSKWAGRRKVDLITAGEVSDRLMKGESPGRISLEHWRQNRAFLVEHGYLPALSIKTTTCALCHKYYCSVHDHRPCVECPLGNLILPCCERGAPWDNIHKSLSGYDPDTERVSTLPIAWQPGYEYVAPRDKEYTLRCVDALIEVLEVVAAQED